MDRDTATLAPSSRDLALLHVLRELEPLSADQPERELIQQGLEIAQAATGSRIAYLHYLNDDGETIELGTWSRSTHGYCSAVYDRHYPIGAAGIWADSARTGAPCVHNDYAAAPQRRGLPEGHSPLERHLGVPVGDGGRVRLLVGVGNKPTDYDEVDVAVLQFVGDRIWALVRQRRAQEGCLELGRRLRRIQEIAAVCGWEYDVDEDRLHFDDLFARLFLTRPGDGPPTSLPAFQDFVVPADHERLRAVFAGREAGASGVIRIGCRRADGRVFPAELKVEFRPRDVGRGLIGIGMLQDVSEQLAIEDLRRRADVDALTGLPNRHRLHELFEQGRVARRGPLDHFAFLFVDLDGFKPVNDHHGHALGDEVLRIVASRLRHMVRKDDLVVRLGGDEFVVVQAGAASPSAATGLADKIIAAVSEPIALGEVRIRVGASIGIALRPDLARGLHEVSVAADRALYRAKAAGGRRWALEAAADAASPDAAGGRPAGA